MQRIRPDVDIVLNILNAVAAEKPESAFVKSLLRQYQERGGLSKKQLQGLHGKASRLETVSAAQLATLEAIIRKKPTRYRSDLPAPAPLYEKDPDTGRMINSILDKYPDHKRVLFLRSKHEHNEVLTEAELSDLRRIASKLK